MEEYRGRSIVVRFDAAKCIHSRHCVLEQPAAFRANVSGPWIHPDSASAEAAVEVAHNCPSGAITYERIDAGAHESAPPVNTAHVRENGPLAIAPTKNGPLEMTGSLEICSGTGRTVQRTQQTWLCRCGGSSNKPFCDGTHKKIGFTG